MKYSTILISLLFLFITRQGLSQLTTPPNGKNKKAMVGEDIGITNIMIHYNRPGVKGREGKIYGTKIVPYGFSDLGFGTSKQAPWRAGANENTTFECSTDIMVEGKTLPAGKYGFFVAMGPDEAIIIFSKNSTSWGSFFYDSKEDALRATVKTVKLPQSVEWLTFDFENQTDTSATIALSWEKIKIPFKVEVDYIKTQIQSFRDELRSSKSFIQGSYLRAAQFCILNNINLPEALIWADDAITNPIVGQKTFVTLKTKATILEKLGRQPDADQLMAQALSLGDISQVNSYGNQLISSGKKTEALEVFMMNYKKYPNESITSEGVARGYAANGDLKKALKYANIALRLSNNDKSQHEKIETLITKLKAGNI